MASILVIDNSKETRDAVLRVLTNMGHDATAVSDLENGLRALASQSHEIVFLDVDNQGGDALSALPDMLRAVTKPEVIVVSGRTNPEDAEAAIRNGAWCYLEKPVPESTLRLELSRAAQYRKERKNNSPRRHLFAADIVGDSPALYECLDQVANAAAADINVLITGETGTGKELFARAIHDNSNRASGNRFIVVDCTSLPKTLVESVLFGHERGAYTGAVDAKEGLIRQADGGTLFLDEIGELPIEIQKKFLRVLQEKHYRPVGAKREEKSDFRVIAATNRDLDELVSKGAFREDLLFRLRAMRILLPPLRDRKDDIKPLTLHQVAALCEKYQTEPKGFSSDFFEILAAHDWPGNVRELNQSLEMAFASAVSAPTLFPKDLPPEIRAQAARNSVSEPHHKSAFDGDAVVRLGASEPLPSLRDFRREELALVERQYLEELLRRTSGYIRPACQISGLSRSRLYTLLKKYFIATRYKTFPQDD